MTPGKINIARPDDDAPARDDEHVHSVIHLGMLPCPRPTSLQIHGGSRRLDQPTAVRPSIS